MKSMRDQVDAVCISCLPTSGADRGGFAEYFTVVLEVFLYESI